MVFALQQENNGRIAFPVSPESYNISVSSRNTVANVFQVGDVNLKGKTGLREVSLSSFFPAKDYNFARMVGDPLSLVEQIEKWRNSDNPCRVVIGKVLNMECTIESFIWGEQDGTGDIYFTLTLKEYKRIKIKKANITVETEPPKQRETKSPKESSGKTYTVKKGDCLWNIAKQFYGNGAQYTKIYEANKDKIKNPNLIYVGQVLTIP